MTRKLCLLMVLIAAISSARAAGVDDIDRLPPAPDRIEFTFTTRNLSGTEVSASGTLGLSGRSGSSWKPAEDFNCSFAKFRRMSADLGPNDRELRIDLSYMCLGPQDQRRRFRLETRVLDADGNLLAHDWQVSGDNRIGPKEVMMSSSKMLMSSENYPWNRLPRAAIVRAAKLDIRLREMRDDQLSHFPQMPHKLELTVTMPNRCGDFDVSFTNPAGWNLDPPKHQIAFQLFVHDARGKLVRADRRFLVYRDTGKYCESVRVEPRYYDYSSVSIAIYTRQPDNDKFINEFFFGRGSSYQGMWTGDAGKLSELPLKGVPLFDDLPLPSEP